MTEDARMQFYLTLTLNLLKYTGSAFARPTKEFADQRVKEIEGMNLIQQMDHEEEQQFWENYSTFYQVEK